MALSAEIIDLVGFQLVKEPRQRAAVVEVREMKKHPCAAGVEILVDVVDAVGVEARRAALQSVDLIPLGEEELGQIRPVLAGDAGDQCDFHSSSNANRHYHKGSLSCSAQLRTNVIKQPIFCYPAQTH